MSHFLGGTCCAVVASWSLVLFAQGGGEGAAADPLAKFEHKDEGLNSAERIEATLDQLLKAPLDYTEMPLVDVMTRLAEDYNIPVVFDNAALEEIAVSPETEITVNLRNLPLRSALNLMLQQPGIEDLTFVVDNDVLLLTTQERADSTLMIRMYRIDDLKLYADPPAQSNSNWVDFTPLIRVITSCVAADTWQQSGKGVGDIILIRPGVLVITQTRRVHEEIKDLLAQMRELKAEIESDTPERLGQLEPALVE